MKTTAIHAGVDFGTSNCSIGIWTGNGPVLLPLEGDSRQLPSALYTSRQSMRVEAIDADTLAERVSAARRRQASALEKARQDGERFRALSDSELENIERGLMRREVEQRSRLRYESQSIGDALYADTEVVFGEAAIQRHIEDPQSGYFIKSPKSFLGADIPKRDITLFSEIITRILAYIKASAEQHVGSEIRNVVLGRPVRFHGTRGDQGDAQAVSILQTAATAAGFGEISFLMEPIAAALDYERSIVRDRLVLVLDAGGGTTDCSMVRIGPSHARLQDRSRSVLGYAGDRTGGTDLDTRLALRKIMPVFGKDSLLKSGLPIPNMPYWNAATINDVNAQRDFFSERTRREIDLYLRQASEPEKVKHLKTVHEDRLTIPINRSAELAKKHLSERDSVRLPLPDIDPELVIDISRDDLRDAIQQELNTFLSLMKEAECQAGERPDVVYVTGGTAKSPIVEQWIRSGYPDSEIVVGDAFGSVASGLTTWAHRLYSEQGD